MDIRFSTHRMTLLQILRRITLAIVLMIGLRPISALALQYNSTYDIYFQNIEDPENSADDDGLRFGGLLEKFLYYDKDLTRFTFTDDLYVAGDVTSTSLMNSTAATSGSILISNTTSAPEWKSPITTLVWYIDGALSTGTDQSAAVVLPFGFTVTDIDLDAKTAPTGAALIVDINENGTTLYSTRPQISDGSTTEAGTEVLSDTTLAAGSRISVDIDQVGSTVGGSSLTIMLHGVRHY